MSVVTHLLLYVGLHGEEDAIERLNAWCTEHDTQRHQRFRQIDMGGAGGSKFFVSDVWAMSANHFRPDDLITAMPTFGWKYPDQVLLVVDDEHADRPAVYGMEKPQ